MEAKAGSVGAGVQAPQTDAPKMDFSEFLKDNRFDVLAPDNATLLGLVMQLEGTSSARFTNKLRTNAGVSLCYEEDVKTNVEIPELITLKMPVFAGGEEVEIGTELRFRVGGSSVQFGVRMLMIEKVVRDMVKSMSAMIAEKTALPVYI